MQRSHYLDYRTTETGRTKVTSTGTTPIRAPQRRTESGVAGPVEYRGLCRSCKHAHACTFPRDAQRPVQHCDEFDGEVNDTAVAAVRTPLPSNVLTDRARLANKAWYPSLCRS